jgi:hypothetical protein
VHIEQEIAAFVWRVIDIMVIRGSSFSGYEE